jgi:oxalate decarboxylase/phosphoglucose isomerase-like protein (cupin superfamily)
MALADSRPGSLPGLAEHDCRLLELPSHADDRGGLMFAEGGKDVPFAIRRLYALYDVPPGKMRGGHGHRLLEQVFVAMSGSFDLLVSDGLGERTVRLSRPTQGVYVGRMMWREVTNFSPGAVCLVVASLPYDAEDYFRSLDDLRHAKGLA